MEVDVASPTDTSFAARRYWEWARHVAIQVPGIVVPDPV